MSSNSNSVVPLALSFIIIPVSTAYDPALDKLVVISKYIFTTPSEEIVIWKTEIVDMDTGVTLDTHFSMV